MAWTGRELRSTINENGTLVLSLNKVELQDPADDEVIVRVEATPVNPSDMGLLLGPADLSRAQPAGGGANGAALTLGIPQERLAGVAGRFGKSLPVGNEGAGTVVAAGKNAAALLGKRVGMLGGAMYADHRKIRSDNVIALPDGASAADGASMFVNPLTALGFIETARREGHKAIIHTAAASNLGQMLQRICLADGIPLINIVRSQEHVDLMRGMGARHVLNSKDKDFQAQLTEAIAETGATVAFDAIGGGTLGNDVVQAMERAAARKMTTYNRYGSDVFKQLYLYGNLDSSPMVLDRAALGYLWSVSGWLLFRFLHQAGQKTVEQLKQRIRDELTSTFASRYTRTIGLADLLDADVLRTLDRKATGEKFLVDPSRG